MKAKQLTQKRKDDIRKRFDKIAPGTLSKLELSYYNKIKAGKARAAGAFKVKGKFTLYPEKFIREIVEPFARREGLTLKEVLNDQAARVELDKIFYEDKIESTYNEKTTEKLLKNLPQTTQIFIRTNTRTIRCNRVQLSSYFTDLKQELAKHGRMLTFWKVVMMERFSKVVFFLPDLALLRKIPVKK